MGATTTTVDGILKDKYEDVIREAMTNGTVLLEKLRRNTEDYDGKKIVIAINKSRNSGLGAAAENGTLPTAGNQGYEDATFTPKPVYGRVEITGPAIRRSKTNVGSFARALDRELRGLERDFKSDANRILNGAGDEVLTTVTTGATSATQTVGSTRFLNDGDTVMLGAATQATIQTVDSDTQITLTASVTTTTADTVKRRIGASIVDEPDGIQSVISDTGTFGGLARSTRNWWKAKVVDAGTDAPLTLALMDQLVREVEKRKNSLPDAFYSNHELRDKYGALLQADQRFVNTQQADGGKKVLSHKDVPFLVDFHAADNKIFAPTWEHIEIAEASPMGWADQDGSVLGRVADKDAYEARFVWEFQTIADDCRRQAALVDVKQTA